jgi:hypothetical protein
MHKDTIHKRFQLALFNIHLSVDTWTSPNLYLLLAVTANFVNYNKEKLVKAFLTLCTIKDHSGEEQFITLLPILQDYNIV